MVKRIIPCLVAAIVLMLPVSCGEAETASVQPSPSAVVQSATPAPEHTPEPTPEISEEPEPEASAVAYDDPRDADWLEDVEYFREKMIYWHPKFREEEYQIRLSINKLAHEDWDLFEKRFGLFEDNINDFNSQVDELVNDIPELSDMQIKFRLQEITSSMGDAHTWVDTASDPLMVYPFSLKVFEGNVYVHGVYSGSGLEQALGCQIKAVNSVDISDIFTRVLRIARSDEGNIYFPMTFMGTYLESYEDLYYLGIVPESGEAEYTLMRDDGTTFDVAVTPRVHVPITTVGSRVYKERLGSEMRRFEKNSDLFYYQEFVEEDGILYVRYSGCHEMPEKGFDEFVKEVQAEYTEHTPAKVLIDLRGNPGGLFLEPLIESLSKFLADKQIEDGCSVYVAIDNSVFSGGVIVASALKHLTGATLIGMPTGQSPSFFHGGRLITLPNSGIDVTCSHRFMLLDHGIMDYPTNTIMPDIYVDDSYEDFINQYDRLYEMVKYGRFYAETP